MLTNHLGMVNDLHWGFKPVFRSSKPYTYPTFIGEEKENEMHRLSLPNNHMMYRY